MKIVVAISFVGMWYFIGAVVVVFMAGIEEFSLPERAQVSVVYLKCDSITVDVYIDTYIHIYKHAHTHLKMLLPNSKRSHNKAVYVECNMHRALREIHPSL